MSEGALNLDSNNLMWPAGYTGASCCDIIQLVEERDVHIIHVPGTGNCVAACVSVYALCFSTEVCGVGAPRRLLPLSLYQYEQTLSKY